MGAEKDKETSTKEDKETKDGKAHTDADEDAAGLKGDGEAESPADELSEEEKKKREEENKKKYANWPLRGIKEPHENDVLYGRGGGTNHHPGNKIYRKMVEDRKLDYVNSKRLDKPLVALDIIRTWRAQSPPGRFLKMDEKTGLWEDVGDKKAREKTSQALREKAPEIRRKIEEEEMIKSGKDPKLVAKEKEKEKKGKETRFEAGTKDNQRDQMSHSVLARDHSLGREYLGSNESIGLDGFTWNPAELDRVSSYGSAQGGYPPGRINSYGSHGAMPPHFPPSRVGSHGSIPPPPIPPPGPEYYHSMSQDERQRSFGSGRYDSWSRFPSGGSVPPPPMPHYAGGSSYQHHTSGSYGMPREHSLSEYPLRDASISQPAQIDFDRRNGSGYWGDPSMPPPPSNGMPASSSYGVPRYTSGDTPSYPIGYDPKYVPPPPQRGMSPSPVSRTPSSQGSAMSPGPVPHGPTRGDRMSPPPGPHRSHSPKATYQVDPVTAQSWTTTQPEDYAEAAGMFGGPDLKQSFSGDSYGDDGRQHMKQGLFPEASSIAHASMGRPDIVKRMTSNQNEDFETKRDYNADGPSIKRAALNRDSSAAANRLKAKYAPGALKKPMKIDKEMRSLSISMENSSLDAKPRPLMADERTSTIDTMTMELMTKPKGLSGGARSSTIDSLALDLDDDVDVDLSEVDDDLPRPPALRTEGRMSTAEYFDIVNEPLGDDEIQQQRPLDLNREASVSEWLSQE